MERLPIGLAHGLISKRDVKKDQKISWQDVEYSAGTQAVAEKREMEASFRESSPEPRKSPTRMQLASRMAV